jgi:predicted nucleic acid-binding protein
LKAELSEIIREGRVRVIGPVCQELLSGIRTPAKFEMIRSDLRSFDEERLTLFDFERAAQISNVLKAKGIADTATDCLMCAVAADRGMAVFTTDDGFRHFAKYTAVRLHTPR